MISKLIWFFVSISLISSVALGKLPEKISPQEAEKRAIKVVEKKAEFAWTYTVLANTIYVVHFIDDAGRVKAKAFIDAFGGEIDNWLDFQYYCVGSVFDSTYFKWNNVKAHFDSLQSIKMFSAKLIFSNDFDFGGFTNNPQPSWRVIDENGKEWYVTTKGTIYDAEKLRRQGIEDIKFLRENAQKGKL